MRKGIQLVIIPVCGLCCTWLRCSLFLLGCTRTGILRFVNCGDVLLHCNYYRQLFVSAVTLLSSCLVGLFSSYDRHRRDEDCTSLKQLQDTVEFASHTKEYSRHHTDRQICEHAVPDWWTCTMWQVEDTVERRYKDGCCGEMQRTRWRWLWLSVCACVGNAIAALPIWFIAAYSIFIHVCIGPCIGLPFGVFLIVKAEHVQKLLARQLAYLSGGVDGCHPILTFPACSREALSQTSDADLSTLLLYFRQLTRFVE